MQTFSAFTKYYLQPILVVMTESTTKVLVLLLLLNKRGRAVAPAALGQEGKAAAGGGADASPAAEWIALSDTPRTHFQLWHEYQHGIGGQKPARLFTREEHNQVKHKYHWRKVVWDCISEVVRGGLTAQVAIDRIYQVYGENQTTTTIINWMKADRKAGRHHELLQI